jgi:hypothetical protein
MCLGGHGGEYRGESGDQAGAVGLVDAVLHGGVDQGGVGRGVGEDGGQEGDALEVEDLDGSVSLATAWRRSRVGKDLSRLTMSFLEYSFGSTSLAFAVLTSKSGMMASALISFAQLNLR